MNFSFKLIDKLSKLIDKLSNTFLETNLSTEQKQKSVKILAHGNNFRLVLDWV